MDERQRGTFGQTARIDRRRVLRGGGALAGASALLAAPAIARADTSAKTLELDVACDGRTFRLSRLDQSKPDALPTIGDSFIVVGSVYPAGTFDNGLSGPDQSGSSGRWICRGTFLADAATAEPGAALVITSVLFVLGDGISATSGALETAADGIVTEGLEPEAEEVHRSVVGGYGRYAGVRGAQVQAVRGTNDTMITLTPEVSLPAPNFTFTFTFASE